MRKTILIAMVLSSAGYWAYAETNVQDPTQPLSATDSAHRGAGQVDLIVQAIFIRASGNQAVINGQRVQVGDVIQNRRIQRISHNTVQLGSGDGVMELKLRPSILTRPE